MWELGLLFAGTALQIFGAGVTIKGARQVWRDVRTPDDRFLAPFIRAWRWIVTRARRMVGRPQHLVIQVGSASATGSAVKARAIAAPGELPDGMSTDDAILLLSKQLRESVPQIYRAMFALGDDLAAKIEQTQKERVQLAHVLDERAERERQRAVGGLRTEAYGFILLTIGTLVQTGGTFAGLGS